MSIARSVAEVLADHTTLELECVDRMYLNLYQPLLQTPGGVAHYLHEVCGFLVPSSVLLGRRSHQFVAAIKRFVRKQGIDLIRFQRGERKDDRAQDYLRRWSGGEGVLFVGVAQEKAHVVRTGRRRKPNSGSTYPWLMPSTAYVNYYYLYAVDEDFGPFFIKFCSYFPFNAKLCLNGHEYLKRQLAREGIAFEALDNGILSCADPERMQQLSHGLTARRIDALVRKWLGAPFQPAQRYHLLDLKRVAADDLPRANLLRAVAGLEQSRSPEDLLRVVEALQRWLRDPRAAELQRAFADWVRQMVEHEAPADTVLPPVRTLEDVRQRRAR